MAFLHDLRDLVYFSNMDFNFVQVNITQDVGDICCPFCSITMENNQEAKMKHLRKYHRSLANPDTRQCLKCLQTCFNDTNFLKHLSFPQQKHICPICNKVGKDESNFVMHFRAEHSRYIRKHWEKCFTCNDYFRAKDIASHYEECKPIVSKPCVSVPQVKNNRKSNSKPKVDFPRTAQVTQNNPKVQVTSHNQPNVTQNQPKVTLSQPKVTQNQPEELMTSHNQLKVIQSQPKVTQSNPIPAQSDQESTKSIPRPTQSIPRPTQSDPKSTQRNPRPIPLILSSTNSDLNLDCIDTTLDWLKPKPFQCVVCNQGFDYKEQFKTHLETHLTDHGYMDIQWIKCQTCGNSGKMKVDESVEHEIKFQCQFCEELKKSKKTNETRLKIALSDGPRVNSISRLKSDYGNKLASKVPLEIHLNSDIQVDSRPLKFVKVSNEHKNVMKSIAKKKVRQILPKTNPDSRIKFILKNTIFDQFRREN